MPAVGGPSTSLELPRRNPCFIDLGLGSRRRRFLTKRATLFDSSGPSDLLQDEVAQVCRDRPLFQDGERSELAPLVVGHLNAGHVLIFG